MRSSPAAKPLDEVTEMEVPVGLAVTAVAMPSGKPDRLDPMVGVVLRLVDPEIVADPSTPLPTSMLLAVGALVFMYSPAGLIPLVASACK